MFVMKGKKNRNMMIIIRREGEVKGRELKEGEKCSKELV